MGGWVAYRQLRVMQGQLVTYQKQLEITDRPWISVIVEPDTLSRTAKNIQAPFDLVLNNVGRSPANYVIADATLIDSGQDATLLPKFQLEQCDVARAEFDRFHGGDTVFPGKPLSRRTTTITGPINLGVLVGCAIYQYGISSVEHHTRFAYAVSRLDPTQPRRGLEFILGEQTVRLVPVFGLNHAD